MKILILGIDGYIGYPLGQWLSSTGYEVTGVDNLWRRSHVASIVPISVREVPEIFDIRDAERLHKLFKDYGPDTIIHLAEQPSAAYSMKDYNSCIETHQNNIIGTLSVLYAMYEVCPDAHLIKLGSMGEYGAPGIQIAEDPDFPKRPVSWYHCTKVHDTHNIQFACRTWGLRCTDIMQGVVYGNKAYGVETRLDLDECFGTVINRFCAAAAVGEPLPVYGDGSQRKSFLPLEDSLQCFKLIIDNPANDYRVVHQFDECYSINDLCEIIQSVLPGIKVSHEFNPRNETGGAYEPQSFVLKDLGYKPKGDIKSVISGLIETCRMYKNNIDRSVFRPQIGWELNWETISLKQ